MVPEALVRQLAGGSVGGRYTVKPRYGSTCVQSVMVVGEPVVVAVPATVGVVAIEGVGCRVGVPIAVTATMGVLAAGVTVPAAPSSRKIINGFPHQCNFARVASEGVGVAGTIGLPPKFNHEHETSRVL